MGNLYFFFVVILNKGRSCIRNWLHRMFDLIFFYFKWKFLILEQNFTYLLPLLYMCIIFPFIYSYIFSLNRFACPALQWMHEKSKDIDSSSFFHKIYIFLDFPGILHNNNNMLCLGRNTAHYILHIEKKEE